MFGLKDLKPRIKINENEVECPVLGCDHIAPRARQADKLNSPRFWCQRDSIYISPSTFEYREAADNLLWNAPDDLELWDQISRVKRESRMARDNSEDAVTWAVFRYLQRQNLLADFVDMTAGESLAEDPRLVYWSYCGSSRGSWEPLKTAAKLFGEDPNRCSEPDLIIEDRRVLLFVENKFKSGNRTSPTGSRDRSGYVTGAGDWFGQVFATGSSLASIAETAELYELMRFWLIGSWIAAQRGKRFILVNVVPEAARSERDIEARFNLHVAPASGRRFVRMTWEQLYARLIQPQCGTPDGDLLAGYLAQKSAGYQVNAAKGEAVLRKAFDIQI